MGASRHIDRDHRSAQYDTLKQAMPSSQPVPALDSHKKLKNLSDLYLVLWKQLDVLLGDGKWFDIAPSQPVDLKLAAAQALQEVYATSDQKLCQASQADYVRVQHLTSHPRATPKSEIESLKDRLRDEALRYAEDAYPAKLRD